MMVMMNWQGLEGDKPHPAQIMDRMSDFAFSQRASRTHAQPISYLMQQALHNPNLISLAAGLVDYTTLPGADTAELLQQILSSPNTASAALQYGTTEGLIELRAELLSHFEQLNGWQSADINVSTDDLVITTGSQQMLFILGDVLIDPDDIVLSAWPSYFVFTDTLASQGAQVRGIDMDEQGIRPEALDAVLKQLDDAGDLPRVKMLYLVSYHQNPTGITLSAERRPQVLQIIQRYSKDHRILIVEDAAYRELTYNNEAPPSIKRYDTGNEYVALLQTFSKPFAPGVRCGYGLLPHDLVDPVVLQKGNHDFGSANLTQHLMLAALRTGIYQHQVSKLCSSYAHKRDVMLDALDDQLGEIGDGVHWTRPNGGLYIYLTLPPSVDTGRASALFRRAIEEGMIYVPGEFCYGNDPTRPIPNNQIRLSFGVAEPDQIRTGIERLARAIKAIMAQNVQVHSPG